VVDPYCGWHPLDAGGVGSRWSAVDMTGRADFGPPGHSPVDALGDYEPAQTPVPVTVPSVAEMATVAGAVRSSPSVTNDAAVTPV
jgi:hypothetical protein